MQKLITIYLNNQAYDKGKFFAGNTADRHGFVEEHPLCHRFVGAIGFL
jgi:hypothetical protein